ncbi:MAG TPA: TadE/TadG family type IV pilus assembly protein [Stellaceae bacterium]|jgi:Flp pilus assembly protein TadG|nr:TadE/TadG family type IV pilus assembly protein [Stellaceae bacterium]
MAIFSAINTRRARLRRCAIKCGGIWHRRSLGRLARAKAGTAAIEFAIGVPVLLMLLVPVADLGLALSQYIKTQQAAQAGALYAANHPWNSKSPAEIASAVTAASTLRGISATPAPSQTCGCPTGASIAAASCSSTCAGGEAPGYYVVVNAQSPYTSQLPYSFLGDSPVLTAQSVIRIR